MLNNAHHSREVHLNWKHDSGTQIDIEIVRFATQPGDLNRDCAFFLRLRACRFELMLLYRPFQEVCFGSPSAI